jgi:glycosyltransferase involved in cell wall biosynthesis
VTPSTCEACGRIALLDLGWCADCRKKEQDQFNLRHRPAASIVIPAHNAGRFIGPAVQSALACREAEVILVAHACTDDTIARAEEKDTDRRLIVYHASPGGGPARAKNYGLTWARGEYVTFLDADDIMIEGSLDQRIERLRRDPRAIAAFGRIEGLIDAAGNPLTDESFELWCQRAYAINRQRSHLIARDIVNNLLVGYATLVYRRSLLAEVGWFDESLSRAEDFDYAYRCAAVGPILFADVAAMYYRIHDSNTSVGWDGREIFLRQETRAAHDLALKKHGLR